MSTTFKVGDRVKLTGKAWAENYPAMHLKAVKVTGFNLDGSPAFVLGGGLWAIHTDTKDWSATLVEPAAPAPDTRKRLRDITDLADGDVVVIAGVPFTVAPSANVAGVLSLHSADGTLIAWSDSPITRDMLVDEVRRRPKTKKRRVYEEVLDDEKHIDGGMLYVKRDDIVISDEKTWVSRSEIAGARLSDTVFRLVEETEVPR